MYYYTATNSHNYPYTWSTTSTTSSTSYTYRPNITYDCSGWIIHAKEILKGLDKEKITEDMIEDLLKEGDN